MTKKDVLNEDLALMIKDGFDSVDKRFQKIDKRFDVVDDRLEKIELKLNNVAYRFELEELKNVIKLLIKRVKKLENKV